MRYVLEWSQGSFETNDWEAIITHPLFLQSTVFTRTPIGLVAI